VYTSTAVHLIKDHIVHLRYINVMLHDDDDDDDD